MYQRNIWQWMRHSIVRWGPVTLSVGIPILLAIINIDPTTHYAGWDNILAEFDYWRYVKQIVGGAWLTYNGLGTPAGLAHLSELFRLPIIGFLLLVFPANMVRYVFIFLMILVGSVGMYIYLKTVWLSSKHKEGATSENITQQSAFRWISAVGAVLYVLHILTIQQFFIAFEVFTVQFAYLPFLLLSVHALGTSWSKKNLFYFALLQLLIAPSGHTPTIFYLTAAFALLYAVSVAWSKGIFFAFRFAFTIGVIMLLYQSYWIVPNVCYAIQGSQAVQESRENILFGSDAMWSVHDAANVPNFLRGTHYLFTWQQYSIRDRAAGPLLGEWANYLKKPVISGLAMCIGVVTLFGLLLTLLDKKTSLVKWAFIIMYGVSILLIWMGFFPDWVVIDRLLASKLLLEIFRNAFTKLSIIYCFICIVFFVKALAWTVELLHKKVEKNHNLITAFVISSALLVIVLVAFPSFQGQYLNPQLKVVFPSVYKEMFKYLKTRNKYGRILQLPQYEYVGWEFYDWTFLRPGNGYSGIGFYPFGMDQQFLQRDSDRWGDASDYFGHELKYALDNESVSIMTKLVEKYKISLIVVDETKIDPQSKHDYAKDHELLTKIGYKQAWKKEFITIYANDNLEIDKRVYAPSSISKINIDVQRARIDPAYKEEGDYINTNTDTSVRRYPFADLTKRQLTNVQTNNGVITVNRDIPLGDYIVVFPKLNTGEYVTPAKLVFNGENISLIFPKNSLRTNNTIINLPTINDVYLQIPKPSKKIDVFINNILFSLSKGDEKYIVIKIVKGEDITLNLHNVRFESDKNTKQDSLTREDIINQNISKKVVIDWDSFLYKQNEYISTASTIIFESRFPEQNIDFYDNYLNNCTNDQTGIYDRYKENGVIYYTAKNSGAPCNVYLHTVDTYAPPYFLHIVGANIRGRGPKLYVSNKNQSQQDVYLFSDRKYDQILSLPYLNTNSSSTISFVLEVRSYGMDASASVDSATLITFPTNYLSEIKLVPTEYTPKNTDNKIIIDNIRDNFLFTFLTYNCDSSDCYVAYNEAYHPGWVAISIARFNFLDHSVLNSWTNAWKLTDKAGSIIIFYWPRLASSFLALIVFSHFTYLLYIAKSKSHQFPSKT